VSTWSHVALCAPRDAAALAAAGVPHALASRGDRWLVLDVPFTWPVERVLELSRGADLVILHAGQTTADSFRFIEARGGQLVANLQWGGEIGWVERVGTPAQLELIDTISRERADEADIDPPEQGELSTEVLEALTDAIGLDLSAHAAGKLK
jgi:hypothetical protein